MTGKVTIVDSAMPTDSGPYLEDGSLTASTLWDPSKRGYLTVVLANNLLKAQTPSDGQDIPNVGKITVKPDGKIVIMGPPLDFLKSNYKQFSF